MMETMMPTDLPDTNQSEKFLLVVRPLTDAPRPQEGFLEADAVFLADRLVVEPPVVSLNPINTTAKKWAAAMEMLDLPSEWENGKRLQKPDVGYALRELLYKQVLAALYQTTEEVFQGLGGKIVLVNDQDAWIESLDGLAYGIRPFSALLGSTEPKIHP